MTKATTDRNRTITVLLNGTNHTLQSIVPIPFQMSKPSLLGNTLHLEFGVLIGITGDIKGRLILAGDQAVFRSIGESMFGMPVGDEMLPSFSGELGNMLAGGIATVIVENDVTTDITAPTIMQGDTTLSGYEKSIRLTATFDGIGDLQIYLLID
ncbi:chemotaxis protein CheX [Oceanobacillus alkalisoli]|uniref:chemotaxis protein CheX n=1 Tax=Oceanobacillus alkalisoli TaxID=2925113 RepID=UPI001EF07143|nr:chemotaxis protein CheX [Oceanobacillus alkalisoli]MCF3942860.1 chemotaxis protein CheX [Oceanobacillus alkalisoli]MCG5102416.1 chemotaxis protein CheX [Oceanobacillus alkalisoli]